jgi:hypothetical protein
MVSFLSTQNWTSAARPRAIDSIHHSPAEIGRLNRARLALTGIGICNFRYYDPRVDRYQVVRTLETTERGTNLSCGIVFIRGIAAIERLNRGSGAMNYRLPGGTFKRFSLAAGKEMGPGRAHADAAWAGSGRCGLGRAPGASLRRDLAGQAARVGQGPAEQELDLGVRAAQLVAGPPGQRVVHGRVQP